MREHRLPKFRYYIETSVWNFLLEEDRPERREITERFFDQVKGLNIIAISDVVTREIARAPQAKRGALERLIQEYGPVLLEETPEVLALADRYVAEKLIPIKYVNDALHVAVAVVHQQNVMVSWNFEHLVKLKTRLGVNGLNRLLGYREIEIVSPEEVTVE